jgi:hypothetical protein
MIATLIFYLEEMMAALIIFTAFFLVVSGAVLIVFVLDQAYKLAFEWAELQLKSFGRFVLCLHQCLWAWDESTVLWPPVFTLAGLFKWCVMTQGGRSRELREKLRRTVCLWATAKAQILTIVSACRTPRRHGLPRLRELWRDSCGH